MKVPIWNKSAGKKSLRTMKVPIWNKGTAWREIVVNNEGFHRD